MRGHGYWSTCLQIIQIKHEPLILNPKIARMVISDQLDTMGLKTTDRTRKLAQPTVDEIIVSRQSRGNRVSTEFNKI